MMRFFTRLFIFMLFSAIPFWARGEVPAAACMGELPETIVLEKEAGAFVSKLPGKFLNYEQNQPGLGYSQGYGNDDCRMTVYLYTMGKGKIDADAAKEDFNRVVREIHMVFGSIYNVPLAPYSDETVDFLDAEYEVHTAFAPKTVELVMEGAWQNRFFKGRTTCQKLDGAGEEDEAVRVRVYTQNLLAGVSESLNQCLKQGMHAK
jgi:hypothetical protein